MNTLTIKSLEIILFSWKKHIRQITVKRDGKINQTVNSASRRVNEIYVSSPYGQFHKYGNYDKAPDRFPPTPCPLTQTSSPCYSLALPGWTYSPPLPQHTNKYLWMCTFSKSLTNEQVNLKEPYNQDIKVHVIIKDSKKEGRLYTKSPTSEV